MLTLRPSRYPSTKRVPSSSTWPSMASRLAGHAATEVDQSPDSIVLDDSTAESHQKAVNLAESVDVEQPLFVLGEEPATSAPAPRDNRASRRRAKHEGLK